MSRCVVGWLVVQDVDATTTILDILNLVTIAIPPALPLALTIGLQVRSGSSRVLLPRCTAESLFDFVFYLSICFTRYPSTVSVLRVFSVVTLDQWQHRAVSTACALIRQVHSPRMDCI